MLRFSDGTTKQVAGFGTFAFTLETDGVAGNVATLEAMPCRREEAPRLSKTLFTVP